MTENEFREALWAGLGRAMIYARDHDMRPFREVILDACLHCHANDPQCEGTRAGFMLELVEQLPDSHFYCDQVLESLPNGGDDWDTVQRFHFATYMAMDGDVRAKQAVYANFRPGPQNAESIGIDFVRLDGLAGFVFAAERIGELLMSDSKPADVGWLVSHTQETFGEEVTLTALRQAAMTNPKVEAYRAVAELQLEPRKPEPRIRVHDLTYLELKQAQPTSNRFQGATWGERTDPENLKLAAHGLLLASASEEIVWHLRIFSRRPFPLDPAMILGWARSADERVASAATLALESITHPTVRQHALELWTTGDPARHHAIAMLASNFEPGDHAMALDWFAQEPDRDFRHWLGMDLKKLWERHPQPATEVRMLLSLYERQVCSECREYALQRLVELDALPEAIRAECRFDASHDIRQMVGGECLRPSPVD